MTAAKRDIVDPAARVSVVHLAGFTLPEDGPHARAHLLAEADRTEAYRAKYDRHTLFYDCVRLDGQDRLLFTAPRFLNLWPLFRDGLRIDGTRPRRLSRRTYPKYELVQAPAPRDRVTLEIDGRETEIVPNAPLAPRFAGLNAVMTMNRNNRLDWIADWLTFHVRAHGLEAALIKDNGSDAYTLDDLARCVASVKGLKTAVVMSAPFEYGTELPRRASPVSPMFLQLALMNLARVETLSRARAVLNADIDELIAARSGARVFDAARRRWPLPVRIPGFYTYPARASGSDGRPQHEHVFRAVPDRPALRKWCIAPGGPFSRIGWFVHQIGGELSRLVPNDRDFHLMHCSATTNDWKKKGRFNRPDALVRDDAIADMLRAYIRDDR